MPIKPENKNKYPKNWKEISEHIRFVRAKNKCEICGVPNYSVGYRESSGAFHPTRGSIIHDAAGRGELSFKESMELATFLSETMEEKYLVIVLTVAHLDHDPTNNDHSNLLGICQRCHNKYDRNHRDQTIKNNSSQLPLF